MPQDRSSSRSRSTSAHPTAACGRAKGPRYIDDARLARSECRGTLAEVRGWLFKRLCMRELDDGSGCTKDEHTGELVVRECLVRNRPLTDFEPSVSMHVEVRPSGDSCLRATGGSRAAGREVAYVH